MTFSPNIWPKHWRVFKAYTHIATSFHSDSEAVTLSDLLRAEVSSSAYSFCSLLTPFLQTVESTGSQWPLSACHATPPRLRCHPSFLVGTVEAVELPCCHGSKHFHILPTLPAQCGHHFSAATILKGSAVESGQSRCILPPVRIPAALSIPTATPGFPFKQRHNISPRAAPSLKIFLKSKFWNVMWPQY